METSNIIAIVAIVVSVLGALFWLIHRSGVLVTNVDTIKTDVGDIKTQVNSLGEKTAVLVDRVSVLWEGRFSHSNSPRALNDYGKKILAESGIKVLIDSHYDVILSEVRSLNPKNAYQAEKNIIAVVEATLKAPSLIPALEDGAFNSGSDIDTLLLVGAINIRERILSEINFRVSDINSPAHSESD